MSSPVSEVRCHSDHFGQSPPVPSLLIRSLSYMSLFPAGRCRPDRGNVPANEICSPFAFRRLVGKYRSDWILADLGEIDLKGVVERRQITAPPLQAVSATIPIAAEKKNTSSTKHSLT